MIAQHYIPAPGTPPLPAEFVSQTEAELEITLNAGPDVAAAVRDRSRQCMAPATPAVWSRYINSRLKQFNTR